MRSLSVRLTVFIAAAMAAVLLLLGGTIFTLLEREVAQQALNTARNTAQQTVAAIQQHARDPGDPIPVNKESYLFGARPDEIIVNEVIAGNVVSASQTPYLPVTTNYKGPTTRSITYRGAPAVYYSQPVAFLNTTGTVVPGAIEVAVTLSASQEALHLLRGLLIWAGLAGLLLISLVGYLFARRALRPVGKLTDLALQISERDLAERLAEPRGKDELSALARAFNSMLERLNIAFQRQSRFVSDASHEMRTPLAVISGYADLLEKWGATQEDVRQEAISAIGRESARLQRLVHDLLFLARGAQGLQLTKSFFDLSELAAETVQEADSLHSGRVIADATRDVVPVHADFDLIKQLLWILLDNAIKFTPEGREIQVRALREGDSAVLAVADEGAGMSEEARQHAFERFYRADPARKSGAGVGLGLAIAKEIADAHRARIEIASAQGKGTTVQLTLPLQNVDEAGAPPAEDPAEQTPARPADLPGRAEGRDQTDVL